MPTMQITGADVGTIDLNDNVNCQIAEPGWIPAVSKRKRSAMGNQSLYEDVVETMPLRVFSENATPATARQEVMDWLHDLSAALEQAAAWYEGYGSASPILFEYEAEDSSLANPLSAIILGVPENATDLLEFKGSYNKALQVYEIFVDLVFERRGLWLGDEQTASGSAVANPGLISATFSAQLDNNIPAPCIVEVGDFSYLNDQELEPSLLVVSPFSDAIVILEAEGAATGDFTSVSDSSLDARGNNVLRYTPPDTDGDVSSSITISGLTAQMVGVIAVVRNNSDTAEYLLSAQLETGVADGRRIETNKMPINVVLDGNLDSKPQIINLGIVANKNGFARIRFWAKAITVNQSLDIDYVVLYDAERAQVVGLESLISYFTSSTYSLEVNHNLLTDIQPTLSMRQSSTRYYFGLSGDGVILSKKGPSSDQMYAAWIAVGAATETAHWRYTSSSSVKTVSLSVTRRPAYLVPV